MTERDSTVDSLKGVGILLVLYGHTQAISILHEWIYLFHMPLFFFVSGFFYKRNKGFFISKFKSIIVPYLFFLLTLILINALNEIIFDAYYGNAFNCKFLDNINYSFLMFVSGNENSLFFKTIWFLPVLFFTELLYYLIDYIRIRYLKEIMILSMYLLGTTLFHYDMQIPYFIDTMFSSIIYIYLGNLFYKNKDIFNITKKVKNSVALIFIIVPFVICFLFNIKVDYKYNIVPIIDLPLSLLSIIGIYFVLERINCNKKLVYIGQNSLILFGLHRPIFSIISPIINKFLIFPYNSFIIVILTVIILYYVANFINKRIPFIIGKF